jgi:adenosylhomocysteine nucleosidase
MSYLIQIAMLEEVPSELIRGYRDHVSVFLGVQQCHSQNSLVNVVVTGVGKVAAASIVSAFIAVGKGKSGVISIGYCGGVSESLKVGDVFIPVSFFQFDYLAQTIRGEWLARPGERTLLYEHASPESILFWPDAKLLARLIGACATIGAPIVQGTLASGDRFVSTDEPDALAFVRPRADAIDMESAAVAQACELQGVGFAAVRVVSDSHAGERELEYLKNVALPSQRYTGVMKSLIELLLAAEA